MVPARDCQACNCPVLLIGFEAQENLGMRSLAAFLEREGVCVGIQPMQGVSKEIILNRVLRENPKLIGFSLIFQRMLPMYTDLIDYLRQNGVDSHFTMGGHFPSFEFEEILSTIAGLDSIVRHEGEKTLYELFHKIDQPDSWKEIPGLVYRVDDKIWANPLRQLITDLDSLPFPIRDAAGTTHRGIGIRSIAGSRGCYYNCSFCSISEFYRRPPGSARRTRSPQNLVQEMVTLYEQHGARIFIFQDDDWFIRTREHRQWLDQFLSELRKEGLASKILWRISCRVDDLDADYIREMMQSGLVSIYLGIESASDTELVTINKGYTAEDVYCAVDLLHKLGMPFEFGFMIFTPDSTLQTVKENVDFLKFIIENGAALIHFCKMSPYAGTAIQRRLRAEGRLEGTLACPDYRFLDPKLDLLQAFFSQTFNYRNFDDGGLVERLRFAKFDACVLRRFDPHGYDVDLYEATVKKLIRRCNESALDAMTFALAFIEGNSEDKIMQHWQVLHGIRQRELATEQEITSHLDRLMSEHGFFTQGGVLRGRGN
jgi:anaerobic magnesium-protoporphyrin IX monomethyl ester cyclase